MSRERRIYTEEFKEKVLASYNGSDESASETARRFAVKVDTVKSWVYCNRTALSLCSVESVKFAASASKCMGKQKGLSPEAMEVRIIELEQQLSAEKMRAESLLKMIEIAERELNPNSALFYGSAYLIS